MKNEESVKLSDIQSCYTKGFYTAEELRDYLNDNKISQEQIISICTLPSNQCLKFQVFYYG